MKYLFFLLFGALSFIAEAQIDKEFWFAVPYIDPTNGNQPVYLNFSAFNQAATVTISQPANPSFKTLTYTVQPNKTLPVNMTSYLGAIANSPEGSVLNKGLLISSTEYITAYYEVLGISANYGYGLGNTEIFNLKGRRGLGQTFYTPFQTLWGDNNAQAPNSTSAIDIVATEDSTNVNITITAPANGMSAGSVIAITLNKGQTYSVVADLYDGADHLTGTLVSSNKPIAVTVKDDSALDGSNYDLIGDQLVPVNSLGKEYIVVKGPYLYYPGGAADVVVIGGTVDSTTIYIDGDSVTTINAGDSYQYQTLPTTSHYIVGSEPIYAFHVIGLEGAGGQAAPGAELAGNLLSSLECTGSRQIGFERSTPIDSYSDNYLDTVYLSVVVKTGYENYFRLINTTTGKSVPFPYPATSKFKSVSSSGYSTSMSIYGTNTMGLDGYMLINDSVDFHLAMMYGEETHSFTYANFADYGSVYLGGNQTFCSATVVTLDAGPDKNSYLWQPGGATTESITVTDTGTYYVTVTKGSCTFKDSARVAFYPSITKKIFNEDSIAFCANQKTAVVADSGFSSYKWQTGSVQQFITPTASGYYDLTVKDQNGCSKTDSIYVNVKPLPIIKISDNKTDTLAFCADSNVTLTASTTNPVPAIKSYLWQNGDTTSTYGPLPHSYPDVYWVKITGDNGCVNSDTIYADCTPYVWVPNVFTPNNDPQHLNEVFFVKGLKPDKWTLDIYNRWGGRVYYKKNYDNSWDGTGLDDGVYYYYLQHTQNKANIKGWVEIVR